ncbi:MAG: hypothetical protein LBJ38_00815 [Oscillospiraceae bacterium]|nr:hypothetical protein [Oscillospiraceae bacterium]
MLLFGGGVRLCAGIVRLRLWGSERVAAYPSLVLWVLAPRKVVGLLVWRFVCFGFVDRPMIVVLCAVPGFAVVHAGK